MEGQGQSIVLSKLRHVGGLDQCGDKNGERWEDCSYFRRNHLWGVYTDDLQDEVLKGMKESSEVRVQSSETL